MLVICMIFMLLSNAFTSRRDLSLHFNRSLLAALFVAMIISLSCNNYIILKQGISLFGGLFFNSSLTITFHTFILFITLIILQLTAFLPRNYIANSGNKSEFTKNILNNLQLSDKSKEQFTIIEYPLIILFIIIGAIFLVSCNDIISVFLAIELQSYGLYLLCSLYRNSELSTGASLTYFLLGGLSSCFILLSLGILYTNSGVTNFDGYYILANLSQVQYLSSNIIYWYSSSYINYSLVILSIGLLFKISAAPFHYWSPDVYDAIPTVVTTFVANIAKISILVFLVNMIHISSKLLLFNMNWTSSLLFSSLLSLLIGTILGLNQSRIKRLLAYSTISHLGFILLAMSINSIESIQAFIFYLMQYSITNVTIFFIIISIGYSISNKKNEDLFVEIENSPIQYIAQLKGFFFVNPALAISLAIAMYSLVGIPPLLGFFAKQMVLSAAIDKGYIFISLVAIFTSVISAVYYLNIVKEIFFNKDDEKISNNFVHNNILNYTTTLPTYLAVTISYFSLVIIFFMLSPKEWLSIANILAVYMFS